jgi:signal transduction histidine kinase
LPRERGFAGAVYLCTPSSIPHVALKRGDALRLIALGVTYVVSARLGLALDAVSGFATLVWPATGIAIAMLVLFGMALWPGVYVGAVIANLMVGAPIVVALGIGVGNTLEAVAAAYALSHIPDFHTHLARLRSVIAFVAVSILATLISPTIGVTSLSLGGAVPPGAYFETWRAWWLGDLIGALIVAPIILVWHTREPAALSRQRGIELGALLATVMIVSFAIFFARGSIAGSPVFEAYMLFPVLIWAAARFDMRGAVTTVLLASVIAIWGTAMHRGPFARPALHESLILLQAFMGVVATTFLVLAATIAERRYAMQAAERARLDAEEANRTKADFMAVMSHELRTPLNAISGYTDLLLCGAQGELTEKQLDSLRRIHRNYQHLLSLIDDVLGFTRVEAGRLVIKTQPVSVAEVIDAAEMIIQPELRRKHITFERGAIDASLTALGDPEKLRQIVVNLLSNAAKYTESGGRVTIRADVADGKVRIHVSDSGIGIPPEQVSRVFDPFYQVERGTTRRYPGIGLGLTIARDLAIAMHGEIAIDSTLGRGTTVMVVLPQS